MQNVTASIKGSKLILEIDLSKDFGESSTGKSTTVASTYGNVSVGSIASETKTTLTNPSFANIKFGLNVYLPKKK